MMATVGKSIDLTLSSGDEQSTPATASQPAVNGLSSPAQPSSAVIDLTGDTRGKEAARLTGASAPRPGPISTSPAHKKRTTHELPSPASRYPTPVAMNGSDLDHSLAPLSNSKNPGESNKRPSTPSAKRVSALGATREKSSLQRPPSSERDYHRENDATVNGSQNPSIAEALSQTSSLSAKKQPLKLLNGHKSPKDSSNSLPVTPIHANGRPARKSAARPHVVTGRTSIDPLLDRIGSTRRNITPRRSGALTNGPPGVRTQSQDRQEQPNVQDSQHQSALRPSAQADHHKDTPGGSATPRVPCSSKLEREPVDVEMLDVSMPAEQRVAQALPSNVYSKGTAHQSVSHQPCPLSVPEFEQRLRYYLARLRADHQYHVKVKNYLYAPSYSPLTFDQSRLCQARKVSEARQNRSTNKTVDSSTTSNSPKESGSKTLKKATGFVQEESPFSTMHSIEHDAPLSKNQVGKLGQYVPKTANASKPILTYPYVSYRQVERAIPPYTNYISTKRNVLIEDDKHRTFLPYLGEGSDVDINDSDYVALEAKIEENQRKYHKMNRIMEKASLHAPFVGDFLKDVGSTSVAVLEFLLDESGSRAPADLGANLFEFWHKRIEYLEDEGYYEDQDDSDVTSRRKSGHVKKPQKQWRLLFESLPRTSSRRELAAACLACHVFSRVAGFSLFHVVKQYRTEQETPSPRRLRSDEDAISVREDKEDYSQPDLHSLGTYAELVCQVCKA